MDERPSGYERIKRLGVVSWSLLGLTLVLGLAVWTLEKIRIIVPPLAVAIAIIYLLNPVVEALRRRGVPRLVGSVAAFLLLIGSLVLVGFLIVPVVSVQANEFATRLPEIVDALGDRLGATGISIGFTPTVEGLQRWWEVPENRELVLSQVGRLTDLTRGVVETVLVVILAPVLAFYLLVDLPNLLERGRESLPARVRAEATHLANQLNKAVGGFVRGQLMVALIVGVLSSVGLRLVGLPFWLLIGMIAGLLNLVPFLGPWVGGILATVVALATRDVSTALWAVLVFVIVQQIDNHLISPNVLRVTVRLHPATIILALLAGGALGGLLGLLVAVPVFASIKIVVLHFWRTRVLGEPWEEAVEEILVEEAEDEALVRLPTRGEGGGEPAEEAEDSRAPGAQEV